jgi:hypothetical protein
MYNVMPYLQMYAYIMSNIALWPMDMILSSTCTCIVIIIVYQLFPDRFSHENIVIVHIAIFVSQSASASY